MAEITHLSYSSLEQYLKCGEQFYRRVIKGHRIPPGSSMIRGSGQHEAQKIDLRTKHKTGALAEDDVVFDAARDAVKAAFHEEVTLDEEEKTVGLDKVRDKTIDQAVTAAGLHHTQLAPTIQPEIVEVKFRLVVPQIPVPVIGYSDCIETDGAINDTKTTGKSPDAGAAENSRQLTLYSLAYKTAFKKPSPKQRLHHLVLLKTPKVVVQEVENKDEDHARLVKAMQVAARGIQKGVFTPAPQGAWYCSPKWCGYYDTCPFVRNRVSVTVPEIITELEV